MAYFQYLVFLLTLNGMTSVYTSQKCNITVTYKAYLDNGTLIQNELCPSTSDNICYCLRTSTCYEIVDTSGQWLNVHNFSHTKITDMGILTKRQDISYTNVSFRMCNCICGAQSHKGHFACSDHTFEGTYRSAYNSSCTDITVELSATIPSRVTKDLATKIKTSDQKINPSKSRLATIRRSRSVKDSLDEGDINTNCEKYTNLWRWRGQWTTELDDERCTFENKTEPCTCATGGGKQRCMSLPLDISTSCENTTNSDGKHSYRCAYNHCYCKCNSINQTGNWHCGDFNRFVRVRLLPNTCDSTEDEGDDDDDSDDYYISPNNDTMQRDEIGDDKCVPQTVLWRENKKWTTAVNKQRCSSDSLEEPCYCRSDYDKKVTCRTLTSHVRDDCHVTEIYDVYEPVFTCQYAKCRCYCNGIDDIGSWKCANRTFSIRARLVTNDCPQENNTKKLITATDASAYCDPHTNIWKWRGQWTTELDNRRCTFQNKTEPCTCVSEGKQKCMSLPSNITAACQNTTVSESEQIYRCRYDYCSCACDGTSRTGNWHCGDYNRFVKVRLLPNHCNWTTDNYYVGDDNVATYDYWTQNNDDDEMQYDFTGDDVCVPQTLLWKDNGKWTTVVNEQRCPSESFGEPCSCHSDDNKETYCRMLTSHVQEDCDVTEIYNDDPEFNCEYKKCRCYCDGIDDTGRWQCANRSHSIRARLVSNDCPLEYNATTTLNEAEFTEMYKENRKSVEFLMIGSVIGLTIVILTIVLVYVTVALYKKMARRRRH